MQTKIVSIDPGLNRVAYAEWSPEAGDLLSAGLVSYDHEPGTERAQKWKDIAGFVEICVGFSMCDISLVIEVPQVYSKKSDKDPNDLIDLAGVVGAIAANICIGSVIWSPLPRDWKGQLPKEITKQRVDKRLSVCEASKITWPAKRLCHNTYDAIHLGLVYLESEGIRKIPLGERYEK